MDRIKDLHLDAGVLNGLEHGIGKTGQVPEIIENHPHFHASGGLLTQNRKNPVPDATFGDDIVLQENIDFRLPEMIDQILKKICSISKIAGLGIAVKPKSPLLQIGRQTPPGR